MRVRLAFPSSIGAFLRQWILIVAIAALGTAESRAQSTFGMEQLDSLTAPIALYPDTLLAQVLIASTYPAEVAQAAQWVQQNSSLQGAALDSALEQQPWDPSVKALVQVPTVLQQMSSKLDWTQQLGDAFLAQQADVMDSVQRLRQRAQNAGQLMNTEQQQVLTQGQTIVIQPTNPQVIYVPSYEPAVVYGGWPYPSYPPYYWPTPPGYAFARGLAWGTGFAIGAAVWDNAFDWGRHDINVNVNRNNFTNINNFNSNRVNNISSNRSNWQHNATNRRGANYRDTATRERYGKTNSAAVDARRQSRGFDQASVTRQLQQRGNQQQLGQRGGQGVGQLGQQRAGQGQLGQRPGQGQLTQQLGQRGNAGQLSQNRSNLERRGQTGGFEGVNNGARTRQASARGSSSRQMMAQNASARGGGANFNRGGAARPQVNRGGGARPQVNRGGGGGRAAGGGGRGGGGRRR